jgi:hypothetical protein
VTTTQPPLASAGGDIRRVIESPDTIYLDGTGSENPLPGNLVYTWTQTSGPAVTLTDAGTATPSFTVGRVTQEMQMEFQVDVENADGTDADAVMVTLLPRPVPHVGDVSVIVNRLLGIESRPAEQNGDRIVDPADIVEFYQ